MTVIAIDGPAGAGKSSAARALARALGFFYLDTGAMYRAVAAAALERGVPAGDEGRLAEIARSVDVDVSGNRILVGGGDPSGRLRAPEVTAVVSQVAALPDVRAALAERQRAIARQHDVVIEGRDIGTAVAPDAEVKIFLTASLPERARRRGRQLGVADDALGGVAEALGERDAADSTRAASPLARPPDAVVIDSTDRPLEDVVRALLDIVEKRLDGF
ncbi:MAG: (d)CMP kinase [Actinomycetota bacterium]